MRKVQQILRLAEFIALQIIHLRFCWKKKEVKTLDDIRSLDDEHQKRRQSKKAASRKPAAPASNNRFNNFEQREYDFSEYEKHLLNQ